MNLESLYHQTNGLVQNTQLGFQKLETANPEQAAALEKDLQGNIDTITR